MFGNRRAFTIIELLVVLSILLIVTVLFVTVFHEGGQEKIRSAARVAQSAVLGARDRALHAKDERGFRLIRDPNDQNIGLGFAYLQPLPPQELGMPAAPTVSIVRPNTVGDVLGSLLNLIAISDHPKYLVVGGMEADGLFNLDKQGMLSRFRTRIKIPNTPTGKWYRPVPVNSLPPYYVTMYGAKAVVQLTTDVVESNHPMFPGSLLESIRPTEANASAKVDPGNEMLPDHAPINLPEGIVIDVARSSPSATQDLMFTPRGSLSGSVAALGPIFLLLRDVRDVIENVDPANVSPGVAHRDNLILAITPQSGYVQTFPIDQRDVDGNGVADDLFRFAREGNQAGN